MTRTAYVQLLFFSFYGGDSVEQFIESLYRGSPVISYNVREFLSSIVLSVAGVHYNEIIHDMIMSMRA